MPNRITPMGKNPHPILKIVIALAFVVSISLTWAQTQAPAAPRPDERDPHAGERGRHLALALGLTEEQAEQLPILMGERVGPLIRQEMETGEEPDIEGAVAEVADELGLDETQRERLTQIIRHRLSGEGRDPANRRRGFDIARGDRRGDDFSGDMMREFMTAPTQRGGDSRQAAMREHMKRQAKERKEFAERLAARLALSDDQKGRLRGFMKEEMKRSAEQFSEMARDRGFGPNFDLDGPPLGYSRGDFRGENRDRRDNFRERTRDHREGFRGERRDRRDDFGRRDFGSRRQGDDWRGDRRGDRRRGEAMQGRGPGPDCCQARGSGRNS